MHIPVICNKSLKNHSESKQVNTVSLYFYLYDDWCKSQITTCLAIWKRLHGIKVSVGIAELGEPSLIG